MRTSKKVTKAEIKRVLRTENVTNIFRVASKSGVDTSNKMEVLKFIEKNAPSQKVERKAYRMVYLSGKKEIFDWVDMPIRDAVRKAKSEKKEGQSNYSKELIEGNKNIYWASTSYGHCDYNKSIAMVNNKKSRKAMKLINSFLNFK